MRRKSERNKGKGSPEKKVEKPTRKSTRRRGKRSPSTSPDRDNSNDAIATSTRDSEGETTTSQSRLPTREIDNTNEIAKSEVTSMEISTIKEEEEVATDAGSVWKVARADASPGEIQKLKLCRQRNLSETSDASSNRKKSNKWHEGCEGITEEIDSADERTTVDSSTTTVATAPTADKIASVLQGRDSSEEVSDSKEFPPEIATAELSDVKPKIDDVDDDERSVTTAIIINANVRDDDGDVDKPSDDIPEPSGGASTPPSVNEKPDGDDERRALISEEEHKDTEKAEQREAIEEEKKVAVKQEAEEKEEETKKVKEEVEEKAEEEKEEEEVKVKEENEKDNDVEMKIVANNQDEVDGCSKNENERSPQQPEKMPVDEDNDRGNDARDSKQSSSDENEKRHDKAREKRSTKRQPDDTSEDNTDDDKKRDRSKKAPLPRTTSRRKHHRDKYRDSSNSESGESEDEPDRDNKRETDKESMKIRDGVRIIDGKHCDEDASSVVENRPEKSGFREIPANNEIKSVENDKTHSDKENERTVKIVSPTADIAQSQINYKPAKVNLKRSFAARPSVESAETKKDSTDKETNDLANQDKENHASSEQNDAKSIPKKRRWGTILAPTDPAPAFSVSTDSLKVLVPGAKPLPINEVRLSKDDDEERERRSQRDKRYSTSESVVEHKTREDAEKPSKVESKKDTKGDNHIASKRKISIVKDTQHAKSPSPPAAIPTSILLIKNLVRPFTLNQIRELLSRTGTIVENGFWMDRIKSKCFVEYVNEDQAFETRQALHGISWPVSNPKKLIVEYATKEDMELARELSKDQPASRKTEPLAANDGWQQDWARDERTNSTTKVTVIREWDLGKEDGQHFAKDRDREKKEIEKKRRQRSRSPTLEAHLPPPARKFKKKEDDPPPAKLLDDLFRKTKATPCIYWLPLTNEQIVVKEEMRRQHMAEHARRLEEMRRAERNRDGRRRRSPRK